MGVWSHSHCLAIPFALPTEKPGEILQGVNPEGKEHEMKLVWKLRIWKETRGQDLIEYALMAGFVAVAAGALMPGVSNNISKIFSKIGSSMTAASGQGS
jgi:pilus assembly protein Flp/PilA